MFEPFAKRKNRKTRFQPKPAQLSFSSSFPRPKSPTAGPVPLPRPRSVPPLPPILCLPHGARPSGLLLPPVRAGLQLKESGPNKRRRPAAWPARQGASSPPYISAADPSVPPGTLPSRRRCPVRETLAPPPLTSWSSEAPCCTIVPLLFSTFTPLQSFRSW